MLQQVWAAGCYEKVNRRIRKKLREEITHTHISHDKSLTVRYVKERKRKEKRKKKHSTATLSQASGGYFTSFCWELSHSRHDAKLEKEELGMVTVPRCFCSSLLFFPLFDSATKQVWGGKKVWFPVQVPRKLLVRTTAVWNRILNSTSNPTPLRTEQCFDRLSRTAVYTFT